MRALTYVAMLSLVLTVSCTSSRQIYTDETENNTTENGISDDKNLYKNLADFLRKEPGLSITGAGENVTVTVRGVNSFNLSITPLYVVDGHAVGNSYMEVNNMLTPEEIDFVRVLKRGDAAIYGLRGGNGVIEIFTRKD